MSDHQDNPAPADPRHERLVALLYGELTADEAEALRLEIDCDSGLRRDWEEIRSAREALASLPAVEPVRGTSWDVMDAAPMRSSAAARARRPATDQGWRPIADPRVSSLPRRRHRLRRLLTGSAWGVAAAALLLLVLGLARFRVERVDHGFAFTVGAESASASHVTREELRDFGTELSRSLAVFLDQRAGQREAEMAAWMQVAFQEVSRRQSVGYGDLRGRIEEVGIGLARGQHDANERINLLLRQDRRKPDSPALMPVIEEGEVPR
jgi:hypothetical protein